MPRNFGVRSLERRNRDSLWPMWKIALIIYEAWTKGERNGQRDI